MSQTVPDQTSIQPKSVWMQALQDWLEHNQQVVLKWLYDAGGWIFAGLIAVAFLVLQSLMTIGHLDGVLLVAGLTLAAALPLNLAGAWIVRDLKNREQAFVEVTLPAEQSGGPASQTPAFSAAQRRFTQTILSVLFGLSVLFTLIGVICALWHISGAVSIVFLIALVISILATLWVLAYHR